MHRVFAKPMTIRLSASPGCDCTDHLALTIYYRHRESEREYLANSVSTSTDVSCEIQGSARVIQRSGATRAELVIRGKNHVPDGYREAAFAKTRRVDNAREHMYVSSSSQSCEHFSKVRPYLSTIRCRGRFRRPANGIYRRSAI